MDDDVKTIFALGAFVIVALIGIGWCINVTEPVCPPGSKSKYSHGWYCVVPPVVKLQ